jgi:hypothetical protein
VWSDINVSGKHITFFFRVKVSHIVGGKVGRKPVMEEEVIY